MFSNLTLQCFYGLMLEEICGCWTDSVESTADLLNFFTHQLSGVNCIVFLNLFISTEIITAIVTVINCSVVLTQKISTLIKFRIYNRIKHTYSTKPYTCCSTCSSTQAHLLPFHDVSAWVPHGRSCQAMPAGYNPISTQHKTSPIGVQLMESIYDSLGEC